MSGIPRPQVCYSGKNTDNFLLESFVNKKVHLLPMIIQYVCKFVCINDSIFKSACKNKDFKSNEVQWSTVDTVCHAALVSRHVRKNVNGNFKQHQKMNKRTGSPAINHNKILSFFQALCQAMLNTQIYKNIAN